MKIEWKQTGNDPEDLIAKIGKDTLRVERMDKNYVWWSVWIGDDGYDCHHSKLPRAKTIDEAKKQCIDKYLEVIKSKK